MNSKTFPKDLPRSSNVIIYQPFITYGGRIVVLLQLSRYLNSIGITPVWISGSFPGNHEAIATKYSGNAIFDMYTFPLAAILTKLISRILGTESSIVFCNRMISILAPKNSIIVNSSNSVHGFLGKRHKLIHYIHFPRDARFHSSYKCLHTLSKYSILSLNDWKLWYYRQVSKLLIPKRTDLSNCLVLFNSQFTQKSFTEVFDCHPGFKNDSVANKGTILYPTLSNVRSINSSSQLVCKNKKTIISIGRFVEAKGFSSAAKAFIESGLSDMGFNYYIVGHASRVNAYYHKLKAMEVDCSTLHIIPNASYAQLSRLTIEASFLISNNINEPFGLTPLEALASGTLPLLHNSGGQTEIVRNEPLLLFDNIQDAFRKILNLSIQEAVMKELSIKLKKHYESCFDDDINRHKFVSHYLSFVNGCLAK